MIYTLCTLAAWLFIGGGILAATCWSDRFEYWLFNEFDRGGNADGWWTTTAKVPARLAAYPVIALSVIAIFVIGAACGADLRPWGRDDR